MRAGGRGTDTRLVTGPLLQCCRVLSVCLVRRSHMRTLPLSQPATKASSAFDLNVALRVQDMHGAVRRHGDSIMIRTGKQHREPMEQKAQLNSAARHAVYLYSKPASWTKVCFC